jgi:hypothetical protein
VRYAMNSLGLNEPAHVHYLARLPVCA